MVSFVFHTADSTTTANDAKDFRERSLERRGRHVWAEEKEFKRRVKVHAQESVDGDVGNELKAVLDGRALPVFGVPFSRAPVAELLLALAEDKCRSPGMHINLMNMYMAGGSAVYSYSFWYVDASAFPRDIEERKQLFKDLFPNALTR